MSLARAFKAGNGKEDQQFVASATIDRHVVHSSLKRRTGWRADLIPALKGGAKFKGRYAAHVSPQSGEMFIDTATKMNPQLRRSAIFSQTRSDRHLHFAPTELTNSSPRTSYKYFVPTGLSANPRFLTISSEHFRVTYPADVDR